MDRRRWSEKNEKKWKVIRIEYGMNRPSCSAAAASRPPQIGILEAAPEGIEQVVLPIQNAPDRTDTIVTEFSASICRIPPPGQQ
jgi:hypothetical protein